MQIGRREEAAMRGVELLDAAYRSAASGVTETV